MDAGRAVAGLQRVQICDGESSGGEQHWLLPALALLRLPLIACGRRRQLYLEKTAKVRTTCMHRNFARFVQVVLWLLELHVYPVQWKFFCASRLGLCSMYVCERERKVLGVWTILCACCWRYGMHHVAS